MKINVYYTYSENCVRVWDEERKQCGQFETVSFEVFELMLKCEFLNLIEV